MATSLTANSPFLAGVIEGFYGRPWPQAARIAYARFLSRLGLNTYLYCPKGDSVLRRGWRERWTDSQWQLMREVGEAYSEHALYWGVGLSPFELYRHYGAQERAALKGKIEYLAGLEAPLFALLFDDMPGDIDNLAERQAEIVSDVLHWMPGVRLIVCPTYYSFDPVLEKVFGAMADDYWPVLGQTLPDAVEVFWTGNKVCSDRITAADIDAITDRLGRSVTLWDNYPVNDSAARCQHLYTHPLADRDPLDAAGAAGHLCNPMNQAYLSLPALFGLAGLYGKVPENDLIEGLLGPSFWAQFARDAVRFEAQGLGQLSTASTDDLVEKYSRFDEPAARELVGWLRGEYAFDPACLTD